MNSITYIGGTREGHPNQFYVQGLRDNGYEVVHATDYFSGVDAVTQGAGKSALYIIELMMPVPESVPPELRDKKLNLGLSTGLYFHELLRQKTTNPALILTMPTPTSPDLLDAIERSIFPDRAETALAWIPADFVKLVDNIIRGRGA